MKYSIIKVNDRAATNTNHNKIILKNHEYIDDIQYFNGTVSNGWEEMNRMQIPLDRWSPYDGRTSPPLPGEYGIWVSTIRALQYMVDNQIEEMMLLEDDIILIDDFDKNLKLCLKDLPKDFDFLSLFYHEEHNDFNSNTDIGSQYIHKSINQYSGALAMIYSLSGAKKILKTLKRKGMEYTSDCFIYHYGQTGVLNGYSIQKNNLKFLHNDDNNVISLIDPENIRHGGKDISILISNNVGWHYEIIESLIAKYNEILCIDRLESHRLYLYLANDVNNFVPNLNYYKFIEYIKNKYPQIAILEKEPDESNFSYRIYATLSGSNAKNTDGGIRPSQINPDKRSVYISHDITKEMEEYKNVLFLSSLNKGLINRCIHADVFPKHNNYIKDIPTYIIQGSFVRSKHDNTRNYEILQKILNGHYDKEFKIKIIGSWKKEEPFDLNNLIDLSKVNPENLNKVELLLNLDWDEYHDEFNKCSHIIPLVSKKNQSEYFDSRITSSFNYGRGYGLNFFIDQDFANTYNIADYESNIYINEDIATGFNNSINLFYNNKKINYINPVPIVFNDKVKVLDSFYVYNYSDSEYISKNLIQHGVWDLELTRWMASNIVSGWHCLDIGFNNGYFSEVMSRLSGPNGSVTSFEPNKKLVNDYNYISKENNYTDCSPIKIFPIALSDKESNKILTVPAAAMGSAYFGENGFTIPKWQSEYVQIENINVECKPLKSIIDKKFNLIKIDIEGHEPEAFLGFAENTLNSDNIIVEVGVYSSVEFLEFLFNRYLVKNLDGSKISIQEILTLEKYQTNIWLQSKGENNK